MSTTLIATTEAYRRKVAQACATGGAMSPIAFIAFGEGQLPYDIGQPAMQSEFARVAASVSRNGLLVTATMTLLGTTVGVPTCCARWAAFTADGTLVGRRVVAPKEFDGNTEMDFELTFQY